MSRDYELKASIEHKFKHCVLFAMLFWLTVTKTKIF